LAVGIGVNLAAAPILTDRAVTCLATHMSIPPPSPEEALDILSLAFSGWTETWRDQGFATIAQAWSARAHGMGAPCQARLENETVEGVAEGLDVDGALRLRLADGAIRRITAGDVFF
jgi:BirA family biotin operon repressor/biotin-[acetyl-CoA-carboxylase] ligase